MSYTLIVKDEIFLSDKEIEIEDTEITEFANEVALQIQAFYEQFIHEEGGSIFQTHR